MPSCGLRRGSAGEGQLAPAIAVRHNGVGLPNGWTGQMRVPTLVAAIGIAAAGLCAFSGFALAQQNIGAAEALESNGDIGICSESGSSPCYFLSRCLYFQNIVTSELTLTPIQASPVGENSTTIDL